MKRPALIVLVRHGKSVLNEHMRGGPFCLTEAIAEQVRQMPNYASPLTERGLAQADALGQHLAEEFGDFDFIIHSGYVRARQTAERIELQLGHNQPLIFDLRLRERDSGYAHGMTRAQFFQAFPWFKGYWEREGWFLARPVGGESIADVLYNRVGPFLQEWLEGCPGKRILIVSHGRAIQAAQLFLEHQPISLERHSIKLLPNCGYVAYRENGHRMILHREYP